MPAIGQLVWGVPDNDIELHLTSENLADAGFDIAGVNEGVGVSLKLTAAIKSLLGRPAIGAFAADPCVFGALEPDVSVLGLEASRNGMFAVGVFRAVEAPSRQQAGQRSNTDAEHLSGEDMIDPRLQVGDFIRQPDNQPCRDFAQEYTRLGKRIKEADRTIGPDVRAAVAGSPCILQRIQHPVGKLRRRKHLIVGKVGDTGQHIGIAPPQRKPNLFAHTAPPESPLAVSARSRSDIGSYDLVAVKISCALCPAKSEPSAVRPAMPVSTSSRKSRR